MHSAGFNIAFQPNEHSKNNDIKIFYYLTHVLLKRYRSPIAFIECYDTDTETVLNPVWVIKVISFYKYKWCNRKCLDLIWV